MKLFLLFFILFSCTKAKNKPNQNFDLEKAIKENKVIEDEIKQGKELKNLSFFEALVPKGYLSMELKHRYPSLKLIKAWKNNTELSVHSFISTEYFDNENLEDIAEGVLKTKIGKFSEVKFFKIDNPYLENIKIYETDDDHPIYVMKSNLKGDKNKEIIITIYGDKDVVAAELDFLVKEIESLKPIRN